MFYVYVLRATSKT